MNNDIPISEMSSEHMQKVLNELEQEGIDALDKYAEYEAFLDVARMRHEDALEALVPQELKDEMRRLKALYRVETDSAQSELTELRGTIDTITLALRHTVRGERKQAVWNKGRTTWDMPALRVYAKSHPEVAALKKTGKPSVTVRKTGKG